jgi:hypothetical protein
MMNALAVPLRIVRTIVMVVLVPLAVLAWLIVVPIMDVLSSAASAVSARLGGHNPSGVRLTGVELDGLSGLPQPSAQVHEIAAGGEPASGSVRRAS